MSIKAPVVIILGAGAGVDLDMPTGRKLQDTISALTKITRSEDAFERYRWADRQIHAAVSQVYSSNMNSAESAIRQIHEGVYLRASIDDYLDRHKANEIVNVCGKLTIARSILMHESQCNLFFNTDNIFNTLDFNRIRSSWLIRFWQMLGIDTATENISNSLDHITIINFNYDRCIEQFLIQALRNLDRWPEKDAHEFVYNRMKIFHPYGAVGRLPPGHREGGVAFGEKDIDLVPLGKNIKTYTEQIEEDDTLKNLHQAIVGAETMIILGFHFHRQNIKLLTPPRTSSVSKVYATVHGISKQDQGIVRSQIRSMVRNQGGKIGDESIQLVEGDCLQLFNTYEKTLSF